MKTYDHKKIESKWQKIWRETGVYRTPDAQDKPKCYVLDMFPYPSGEGLHVGHPRGYIATDIYARYKRMQGFAVLHPMGWDAFGLPAENYALQNKVHPRLAVKKNIARFKKQLELIGFDYDWEREINTTDPEYYKWTQWIFLQLYKSGLAYYSNEPINWCPSCKTGLANEDVEDGRCERCGTLVEQKLIPQWVLRITKYADRLLKDLDDLPWPESIKEAQRHWIGRDESTGTYRLKDCVFSRQRYWGEPIPLIHCERCGVVSVPEEDLPVTLPEVEYYESTNTGESPLAAIESWVNVVCPGCGGAGKRETNTMPQWAGSSWYYMAYPTKANNYNLKSKKLLDHWLPVDVYVGGAEHATRHLIYARFWHKFLHDIGVVTSPEPFGELHNVGLINADDGRKMSKRWGNVINPDDIVTTYGADTLRLYEMFMGPFNQSASWSTESIMGPRRFLERVWRLTERVGQQAPQSAALTYSLGKTAAVVADDIAHFRFNTAVSKLMIVVGEMEAAATIPEQIFKDFLKLLAPFAPHLSEELWQNLGHAESIHLSTWPVYELAPDEFRVIAIQVNGRVRDTMEIDASLPESEIIVAALARPNISKWLGPRKPKKTLYVKDKVINFIV